MGKPIPKRLEDFAKKYVPLLRTYLQREETRDIDKLIRDELVKKMQGVIDTLAAAKTKMVDGGKLIGLDILDRSTHKLEKVRDTIKFASRGYTGIFNLEQMADDQLNKLIEFDQKLFAGVDELAAALKEALDRNPAELKTAFAAFDAKIAEFEQNLDGRDAFARDRKLGK
jgi:hypothetical protein